MKKIKHFLIFIFPVILTFFICFASFDQKSIRNFNHANYGQSAWEFLIPNELSKYDSLNVLKQFDTIMQKHESNLIIQTVNNYADRTDYIKHIIIHDTKFYEKRQISHDLYLNNYESEFISSIDKQNIKQKGIIQIFNDKIAGTIQTLKYSIAEDDFVFAGYAIVESSYSSKEIIEKDLQQIHEDIRLSKYNQSYINLPFEIVIYLILALMLFYLASDLIRNLRSIAIKKLFGCGFYHIWIEVILPILLTHILCIFFGNLILLLVFNKVNYTEFVYNIFRYHLFSFTVNFIILTVLAYKYYNDLAVSAIIKRKNEQFTISIFERILKPFMLLFNVIIIILMVERIQLLLNYNHEYRDWKQTTDLFIVPAVKNITYEALISKEFSQKQKNIYQILEEKGAILADFSLSTGDFGVDGIVNYNYILEHQIKDQFNQIITIPDIIDSSKRFLLIPEIYLKDKNNIIDIYVKANGISDPAEINVIITKKDQQFFTYLLPSKGISRSYFVNPIISLHMPSNNHHFAHDVIAGTMHDPFKIRINDSFTSEQYNQLLIQSGMITHYAKAINLYEQVSAKIQSTIDEMKYLIASLVIMFAFFWNYIYRDLLSFISDNIQNLTVKKLFGYSYIDKYIDVLLQNIVCWILVYLLFLMVKNLFIRSELMSLNSGSLFYLVFIIMILAEYTLSFFLLRNLEEKKVTLILKGDRD